MKVNNLTDKAVLEHIDAILDGLRNSIDNMSDPAYNRDLLQFLIDSLNDCDYDDFFGTEGWKHNFGIED